MLALRCQRGEAAGVGAPLPHHCHIALTKFEPWLGDGHMADYYSVIATAVSRLPSQNDEARCAIYDRARTALQEALRDFEPPLLAKEQAALDDAIRTLEVINDIREEAAALSSSR